tara:strand:+ start:446 stop:685 length:240 start_codon:yes stop_codon:yes gene_type:complete
LDSLPDDAATPGIDNVDEELEGVKENIEGEEGEIAKQFEKQEEVDDMELVGDIDKVNGSDGGVITDNVNSGESSFPLPP